MFSRFVFTLLFLVSFFLIFPISVSAVNLTISEPQVVSDVVTINVSISGLSSQSCPNTICYLQGMFTSLGQTKYFGLTQNNSGQWYEYNGSPESSYIANTFFSFTPVDDGWNGSLIVKNNPDDSDYDGPGDYNLKVKRYTGNSSSSTSEESNILTIQLTTVTLTPTPSPTGIPTQSPTSTPTPTKSPTPIPTKSPTPKPSKSPSPSPEVLGEEDVSTPEPETPSATPLVSDSSKKKFPLIPVLFIGSGLVMIGVALVQLKNAKKSAQET